MSTTTSVDLREFILRKRDGGEHPQGEIDALIEAVAKGRAGEAQVAAWLMAVFLRGLTSRERADYVGAMARHGSSFRWDHLDRPTADKHSTGGVGDKVSLVWAPLMAAAGFAVPMISGRGLGLTGGTLDKLESIPGYRCDLSAEDFRAVVAQVGCSITGQTEDMVPADRILYDLRNRTGTIETLDHIAPSILSKKLAEGAENLILDVKVGRGAFMKTLPQARALAETMVELGTAHGRKVVGLLTSMDALIGETAGNSLEVEECLQVLSGGGPHDLRRLTVRLAAEVLLVSGECSDLAHAEEKLSRLLDNGAAMEKWERMVAAQGGNLEAFRHRVLGEESPLLAQDSGWVEAVDALSVGEAVAALGGVRGGNGEAPDPSVGLRLLVYPGDRVEKGDPWAELHHRGGGGLPRARELASRALILGDAPSLESERVLGRIVS